jgi:hypothetical protein
MTLSVIAGIITSAPVAMAAYFCFRSTARSCRGQQQPHVLASMTDSMFQSFKLNSHDARRAFAIDPEPR